MPGGIHKLRISQRFLDDIVWRRYPSFADAVNKVGEIEDDDSPMTDGNVADPINLDKSSETERDTYRTRKLFRRQRSTP